MIQCNVNVKPKEGKDLLGVLEAFQKEMKEEATQVLSDELETEVLCRKATNWTLQNGIYTSKMEFESEKHNIKTLEMCLYLGETELFSKRMGESSYMTCSVLDKRGIKEVTFSLDGEFTRKQAQGITAGLNFQANV